MTQVLGSLPAEDLSAITHVCDRFVELVLAGDFGAAADLYTPEATLMPPHRPAAHGRAAIAEFLSSIPVTRFTLDVDAVEGRADLAYVRGRWTARFETPLGSVHDAGKFIEIRRRQPDGSWLMESDIFNSDLPAAPAQPSAASREANKAVVTRLWYEELWDKWNIAAADELFSADYRLHLSGVPVALDRDATKQAVRMFSVAFPDLRHTVDEMVAENDSIAARWTVNGTHAGEFQGIAATGRHVTLSGTTVHHMRGGKVVETWLTLDNMELLQQLK